MTLDFGIRFQDILTKKIIKTISWPRIGEAFYLVSKTLDVFIESNYQMNEGVRVFQLSTGNLITTIKVFDAIVKYARIDELNKLFIFVDANNKVNIVDANNYTLLKKFTGLTIYSWGLA